MYTIGDFLIQIKNAYGARKKIMSYPYSNAVFSIGKILEKEGFVKKISAPTSPAGRSGGKSQKSKSGAEINSLEIELKYKDKRPAVSDIKLISKPSIHYHMGFSQIKKSIPKYGTTLISTNRGIMTAKDINKERIGGEIICQIY